MATPLVASSLRVTSKSAFKETVNVSGAARMQQLVITDVVVGDETHVHDLVATAVSVPAGTRVCVYPHNTGSIFKMEGHSAVVLPRLIDPSLPMRFEFAGTNFGSFTISTTEGFTESSCVMLSRVTRGHSSIIDFVCSDTPESPVRFGDPERSIIVLALHLVAHTTRSADGAVRFRLTGSVCEGEVEGEGEGEDEYLGASGQAW